MADARCRCFVTLSLLLVACSQRAAPAAAPSARTSATGIERYLPLPDATVYAYDTLSETTNETGMLVLEVRRARPEVAELRVAGRVQLLEIATDGVRHSGGGYLLKTPLTAGARFQGDFGTVEITAIGRSATVPAGHFDDCIETVESASTDAFSKRTTTLYCAGVGITSRRTEAESDDANGAESMRLRSFGPKFESFR